VCADAVPAATAAGVASFAMPAPNCADDMHLLRAQRDISLSPDSGICSRVEGAVLITARSVGDRRKG
jgi:hypothetical protein